MTVFLQELRRNRLALLIWSGAIAVMLVITVVIFPEMKPQMSEMEDMLANMGSLSDAFGMSNMSFARFTDYFATECGNVLGLGGAIFAAILGVGMLGKEEREHTAEFLYTHPLSRTRIVLEKLLALVAQVVILNAVVAGASMIATAAIGEEVDWGVMVLMFVAYLLLELEIAFLCFCVSAFLKNGMGAGLGIAIGLYFLNILANLTEDAKPLKYLTPFAFAEGSYIIENHALKAEYLAVGAGLSVIAVAAAFLRYHKKDLGT